MAALFAQLISGVWTPFIVAYVVITILFNVFWWYQFLIALGGFIPAKRPPKAAPRHRFAVIVPAHNEETVVGYLVRELLAQDYPRELFEIFVSCDNCTDRTADVAREAGAQALIRSDVERAGKQWNLKWAFEHVPIRDFDAVAIFDADNVPERDFLARMNDMMVADPGADVIQGYLDSKNPDDTWVSRASALAYWYTNRFWQQARMPLGLSAQLGGTGAVIRTEALERIGWDAENLTDDLVFTTRLILAGGRVSWNEWARTYDEKPTTFKASYQQRSRWMRGHYWVLYRYGARCLAEFVRKRRLQYLDLFMYLVAPARLAVTYCLVVFGFGAYVIWLVISGPSDAGTRALWPGVSWIAIGLALSVLNVLGGPSFRFHRLTLRYLPDVLSFFWFGLILAPIAVSGAFRTRDQRTWRRTDHVRGLALDDLAHRKRDAAAPAPDR